MSSFLETTGYTNIQVEFARNCLTNVVTPGYNIFMRKLEAHLKKIAPKPKKEAKAKGKGKGKGGGGKAKLDADEAEQERTAEDILSDEENSGADDDWHPDDDDGFIAPEDDGSIVSSESNDKKKKKKKSKKSKKLKKDDKEDDDDDDKPKKSSRKRGLKTKKLDEEEQQPATEAPAAAAAATTTTATEKKASITSEVYASTDTDDIKNKELADHEVKAVEELKKLGLVNVDGDKGICMGSTIHVERIVTHLIVRNAKLSYMPGMIKKCIDRCNGTLAALDAGGDTWKKYLTDVLQAHIDAALDLRRTNSGSWGMFMAIWIYHAGPRIAPPMLDRWLAIFNGIVTDEPQTIVPFYHKSHHIRVIISPAVAPPGGAIVVFDDDVPSF